MNEFTRRAALAGLAGMAVGSAAAQSAAGRKRADISYRKPIPQGVIEHTGLAIHSVLEMRDGSLLTANGRRSTDQGKTWSAAAPLGPDKGTGLTRLASGAIVMMHEGVPGGTLHISNDEGKTWGPRISAFPAMTNGPNFFSYGDGMIQLRSGRLVWSASIDFNPKFRGLEYDQVTSKGLWRGKPYASEGHQHLPEFYATMISLSDDEGKTWRLAEGYEGKPQLMWGWFDEKGLLNGYHGHTSFGETTIAETKSGEVLMVGRSEVGRIVYTYSPDGGTSWDAPLPSQLPNSGSPARLRGIPSTGDLICVWNQVSHEEIRRGYRRGRLTAAISTDGGNTWGKHKTLELSEGLEDIARLEPEMPIAMIRARDTLGTFPDGFAYFHYPNVNVIGDRAFVSYLRGSPMRGIAERGLSEQTDVLRVYPLDYFYS